jgi:hypothetical protein
MSWPLHVLAHLDAAPEARKHVCQHALDPVHVRVAGLAQLRLRAEQRDRGPAHVLRLQGGVNGSR